MSKPRQTPGAHTIMTASYRPVAGSLISTSILNSWRAASAAETDGCRRAPSARSRACARFRKSCNAFAHTRRIAIRTLCQRTWLVQSGRDACDSRHGLFAL